ncbi:unnamed protein product, partial [Effrenium voratum]
MTNFHRANVFRQLEMRRAGAGCVRSPALLCLRPRRRLCRVAEWSPTRWCFPRAFRGRRVRGLIMIGNDAFCVIQGAGAEIWRVCQSELQWLASLRIFLGERVAGVFYLARSNAVVVAYCTGRVLHVRVLEATALQRGERQLRPGGPAAE